MYAVGFSLIAAIGVIIGGLRGAEGNPVTAWLVATAFYLVAGVLGGAVFGLLRPFRKGYIGRFVTAYVILLLVYAGGYFALWPFISDTPGERPSLDALGLWAVVCLVLPPLYVGLFPAES